MNSFLPPIEKPQRLMMKLNRSEENNQVDHFGCGLLLDSEDQI